jgi:hypothetical protein
VSRDNRFLEGIALGQALALALPGADLAAVAYLTASTSPADAALATQDPVAAAELLELDAGRTIRQGPGRLTGGTCRARRAAPLGMSPPERLTWARSSPRP